MADDNNIEFSDDSVSKAQDIKNAMKEIARETGMANKEMQKNGEMITFVSSMYSKITSSASKVSELQASAAKSTKATAKAVKEQEANQNRVKDLNIEINKLYKRAKTLTGDAQAAVISQARNLSAARDNADDLSKIYGDIASNAAKLDARTSFFSGISDVVSDIPGLRKLAGPFQDAAKAARQTVISNSKGGKQMSVLAAGAKGFAKSAASSAMNFMKSGGYVGLIVGGITGLVKLMLSIDKSTAETASAFNETKEAAAATVFNFNKADRGASLLTQRMGKGAELANTFANSTGIMSKNVEVFNADLDTLNYRLGLSVEQTQEIARSLVASGQSSGNFATEALGAAEALEMQLGVNISSKAIMQDIATSSASFRVNSDFSAKALSNAAVQARKVGLTLSQVENISAGLLDYETSIEAEMTAQLLTGKKLDLSKARAAAANQDYATVAKEISKQEAIQEAFSTNNVYAQEAIAKSLSMSKDDLAKMFMDQKALEKAGFATADAREQEYQKLLKTMTQEEALKKIGMEQFTTMKNNLSFQDKMNNLLENMKKIFMISIAPAVEKVFGFLEQNPKIIEDTVRKVEVFAASLGGPEGKITNMLGDVKSISRIFKGIGQIIHGTLISPLSAAYHAVMAVVSALQAAYYFKSMQFDLAKQYGAKAADHGMMAVTSALDIGTGIAAGIGTLSGQENMNASGITDAYKSTGGASGNLKVDDFTIQTNPKDTLTMAGGTKLGGNVEKLLQELIKVVKEGGDVYLDGGKVGSALALGARLTN